MIVSSKLINALFSLLFILKKRACLSLRAFFISSSLNRWNERIYHSGLLRGMPARKSVNIFDESNSVSMIYNTGSK